MRSPVGFPSASGTVTRQNLMRPLLLLDVDGVLNPDFTDKSWRKRESDPEWVKKYVIHQGEPLRVYLNTGHGAKLLAAAADAGADLGWATTWNGLANAHIAPAVGLPRLPVYYAKRYAKPTTVLPALESRNFVWLDDEMYVIDACDRHPGGAGVWVHARSGLQDHHLTKAVKILKGYADDS